MPLPQALENVLASEIDPAFEKRARFVLENIQESKPKKVLDAGCGRGFYPHAISAFDFPEEIQGIDIGEKYLKIAKSHCTDPRIKLQIASIYELPFPDNYFDCVVSSEVMEHVEDLRALTEIKRVTKAGGMILITVPHENFPILWDPLNWCLMKFFGTHINKDVWWLAGIWADHVRLYTKDTLKKLAQDAELNVEKSEEFIAYCWPFTHFFLYGIGKNVVEWFGTVDSFYRFNFEKKPLSEILATFTRFPSFFDPKNPKRSMGLGIKLIAKK